MKIIDKNTKEVIADIIGGENMPMDEVLDLNAWYDDLEMVL